MLSKLLLTGIVVMFLTSCAEQSTKPGTDTKAVGDSLTFITKPSQLEPRMFSADSLQVIYYDDPDGDSLRFSRFFTYSDVSDTGAISRFLKALDRPFSQQSQPKACRSEGKIYLYQKEDVLKTLYFSTRGDSCSYAYFIKDGSFYYLPLEDEAMNSVKSWRTSARKP